MPPTRMRLSDLPDDINELSGHILDAAIEVHEALGSGLLENAYHRCLAHELRARGLLVSEEVPLALTYKGLAVPGAYFADLIVEGKVVVELKCVEAIAEEHEAQLLTYQRLSGCRLGIILNFHAALIRDGFLRRVL